ncbi:DUF2911 domain-containing protein [Lutibacter sp.]|uniref:DUF2911 domain-containing protein n=1 Tax=Lutibacter sp. TaxID=1925666 RepID=UPI0035640D20
MRKYLIIICLGLVSFGSYAQHNHQSNTDSKTETKDKPAKSLSPHTNAMAMIGDAHIHIDYSAPSVRNRVIFGGLVGYDTVWQAGAHNATWIMTDKDLDIDGEILPAGKYGFFVIPGKETWEVMLNTRWNQHGKDEFNKAENVVSIVLVPEKLNEIQESLLYDVKKTGENKGVISLAWEKVKIEIPFSVAKH